jgi:hypothetical protein
MGYKHFYQGNPSSLDPEYGGVFTKYRIPASHLGATTSVQTANQVKEVTNLLNQGMKAVEVSVISPEVFEMIPTQHLKEINRLTKLTGSETSLHAPIIDPSGFTQQGWDENNRIVAEKQFMDVVERARELNPQGNIPVTIHSSGGVPGTEHIEIKDPQTGEIKEVTQKMIAVNRDSGQLVPLTREERFYPDRMTAEGKGENMTPERLLKMANNSDWINKITNLAFYKKEADEVIQGAVVDFSPALIRASESGESRLTEEEGRAFEKLQRADLFLNNVQSSFINLFDNSYKYAKNNEAKKELLELSKDWKEFAKKENKVTNPAESAKLIIEKSTLLDESIDRLKRLEGPNMIVPVEQFVKEKASLTLGNVAFSGYQKFHDNAPIVSIENPPYGSAVSRAQDLKELIEESRRVFIKNAKAAGINESEAKKAAEKMIGATWDTSHIAMLRKQGFKSEKLIEEAGIIAPYVKHVHLNDNLGSTHTDLPPGLGNVPLKEVMEKLGKAGFEGKKIFEGGNFFQHFQTSPHPYVLEGFGSPIYRGSDASPYWNQTFSTYAPYFAGYGTILPEQYFSRVGGGFTGLPTELGGQTQTRGSRASGGTPLA